VRRLVPREEDQHEMEFMHETGFTCEQAARETDDIPITHVVALPHVHRKPFVTEKDEIGLGT